MATLVGPATLQHFGECRSERSAGKFPVCLSQLWHGWRATQGREAELGRLARLVGAEFVRLPPRPEGGLERYFALSADGAVGMAIDTAHGVHRQASTDGRLLWVYLTGCYAADGPEALRYVRCQGCGSYEELAARRGQPVLARPVFAELHVLLGTQLEVLSTPRGPTLA